MKLTKFKILKYLTIALIILGALYSTLQSLLGVFPEYAATITVMLGVLASVILLVEKLLDAVQSMEQELQATLKAIKKE